MRRAARENARRQCSGCMPGDPRGRRRRADAAIIALTHSCAEPSDVAVPGSIIQTKLYVPSRRRATVPRPRLNELLSRGIDARLVLVSPPAGFGKTTLLSAWLAAAARPARLTHLEIRGEGA